MRNSPIFAIIAAGALALCFMTPQILITVPLLVVVACAVISFFRKERLWWIGAASLAGAVLVFVIVSSNLANISSGHGGDKNLPAAKITDWSWRTDKNFGTHGTIKWTVAVQNVSDKPISLARVEFSTYDPTGKLLTSTFAFVHAIPPGETRTEESFADYYGNELTGKAALSDVSFSE